MNIKFCTYFGRMDYSVLGPHSRRLAAILFTDMVGYTALMQRDELLAIAIQKRHQAVVEEYVVKYGGQVKNDTGDGSMNILPSAIQAIQCAMAIQTELKNEPQVNIRIGIHIADIIEEENGKIHGDGINVASRIETLGVAGAILFSKEVYNKVKNHPEFSIQSVGLFPFKNVEEPMEIYGITNKGFSVPSYEQALSTGKLKKETKSTGISQEVDTSHNKSKTALKIPLLLVASVFIGIALWNIVSYQNRTSDSAQQSTVLQSKPLKELYEGRVIDYRKIPVANAIVIVNDGVAVDTTDAGGNYKLELPRGLKDEKVTISIYYNGKLNFNGEINLSHNHMKELKLVPESN